MSVVRTKKTLKQAVKGKVPKQPKKRKEPLWKGPQVDGVTQSMLSSFLVCRERFRLRVMEGMAEPDEFSHTIEYGSMWHICEENSDGTNWGSKELYRYAEGLCRKYPSQQEQIAHWMHVCETQFEVYLKFWKGYSRREKIKPLLSEQAFAVPYELSNGRAIILRGKWDGVCLVDKGLYLWENKTKGDIVEQLVTRQLTFDLQTMFYAIALWEFWEQDRADSLLEKDYGSPKGLVYNVVRRPLSGGKGSIRKLQPTKSNPKGESDEAFYGRLRGIIEEDPGYFFMRWKVGIYKTDIEKFKREFLNPILEQLCDWYDWVSKHLDDPFAGTYHHLHWRHPYGVWNPMDKNRPTELDEYLANGSELGLVRKDKLFEELE